MGEPTPVDFKTMHALSVQARWWAESGINSLRYLDILQGYDLMKDRLGKVIERLDEIDYELDVLVVAQNRSNLRVDHEPHVRELKVNKHGDD